jgi:hypothetical protein
LPSLVAGKTIVGHFLQLGVQTDSAGANPTTVSYNARVVKIYSGTSSLVRFENKNVFFYFENML